jgi:uncharacterized membrane protein YkvA (DUF1232 family)
VSSLAARLARVVALLKDPRTPRLPKALVLAACLYLLWPLDLVPEMLTPVFGFLDDATFLWLGLRYLLKKGDAAQDAGRSLPPAG